MPSRPPRTLVSPSGRLALRAAASLLLLSCAPAVVAPDPASPAPPPSIASPPGKLERTASPPPFDRGAAVDAIKAVDVAGCGRPGGPKGPGRVVIVFAIDGAATAARVDGSPYEGTAVGDCVAEKFRGVRIPAFDGGAIAVNAGFRVD